MLCEHCHKNEATVHYTEIINGRRTEEHLCQACAAKEHRMEGFGGFGMNGFGGSLFGSSLFRNLWSDPLSEVKSIACPECRTTLDTFRKEGKLGCPDCYETFRDSLRPFFKKSQEGTSHVGKTPTDEVKKEEAPESEEVKALKAKLAELIKEEKYEEAAKVRDELKKAEGEKHDNS